MSGSLKKQEVYVPTGTWREMAWEAGLEVSNNALIYQK